MTQLTKYQEADQSIAAYDAFIFACPGKPFDGELAEKADLLAATAMICCREAARDLSMNQTTRNVYRALYNEFKAICS
jgi:hypothetical protein